MIKELGDLPSGVIGFETAGKIQAEDFRDVVLPAFERAAKSGEMRAVIVIPEFHGMTGGAVWEDLKVGIPHLAGWKRVAVVSDIEWITHLTHLFGWMTPGEIKTFPLKERASAIEWVSGSSTGG
jgi:hypothetical protein